MMLEEKERRFFVACATTVDDVDSGGGISFPDHIIFLVAIFIFFTCSSLTLSRRRTWRTLRQRLSLVNLNSKSAVYESSLHVSPVDFPPSTAVFLRETNADLMTVVFDLITLMLGKNTCIRVTPSRITGQAT